MNSIHVEVKTITPEMAVRMLQSCPYEMQRRVKPWKVKQYAHDMCKGNWNPGTMIELATYKGDSFLINGQHRLHALIESNTEQVFTLKEEVCGNMEEIAHRYYTIDIGAGRSFTEAVNATDLSERLGITKPHILTLKSAASLIYAGFPLDGNASGVKKSLSPDDSLQMVKFWQEPARLFFDALLGGNTTILRRMKNASVVGVGLVTCKYQSADATRFWSAVARNDGLTNGQPEKVLVDFLLEDYHRVHKIGNNVFSKKVARCWNAFFEQRSLRSAKVYADAETSIHIAGTPFAANRPITGMGLTQK